MKFLQIKSCHRDTISTQSLPTKIVRIKVRHKSYHMFTILVLQFFVKIVLL